MYEVSLDSSAKRFLKKLDKSNKERIITRLRKLKENPHFGKSLVGNFSSLWSLRIGKYRAIYKIVKNRLIIVVLEIDYRKKVYG